ncbi:hypothetical protein D9M72_588770 [compost metagenome]
MVSSEARSSLPASGSLSRRSSSIWIMVGASSVSVTRSLAMVSSTVCGTKFGSTTWVPPLVSRAETPMKPAMWNIGMTCRTFALIPLAPCSRTPMMPKPALLWLIITPFGKPVVPPV